MAEKIATGLFLVFGIVWLKMSYGLAANNFGGGLGVGPDFFPRILSIVIIVLSFVHLLKLINKEDKNDSKININNLSVYIFITTLAYLITVNIFGYIIATFLYIMIIAYLISGKKKISDLLASIAVTLTLYTVFQIILNVPLPKSIFL
jgi:cytochrome c biogenesis factor